MVDLVNDRPQRTRKVCVFGRNQLRVRAQVARDSGKIEVLEPKRSKSVLVAVHD